MFDRVRAHLSWELETIEEWLLDDAVLAKDRAALERAAGQRRWALERNPTTPGGYGKSTS